MTDDNDPRLVSVAKVLVLIGVFKQAVKDEIVPAAAAFNIMDEMIRVGLCNPDPDTDDDDC